MRIGFFLAILCLVQSSLETIKRSKFKAGVARNGCKTLIIFSNESAWVRQLEAFRRYRQSAVPPVDLKRLLWVVQICRPRLRRD